MQNYILYKNNFEHKSFRRQDPEILIHHYVISLAMFKNVLEKYNKILLPDIACTDIRNAKRYMLRVKYIIIKHLNE